MKRRDLRAALAGAAAVIVLAGGVAWAAIPGDGGVYTACMLKNVGTVRLIDKSLPAGSLMSHCKPAFEVEVSWSQTGPQGLQGIQGLPGQNGADGESPAVQQLAAGDANCPAGGAALTDASGATAYVCNGAAGEDGTDGEPFSGTFTSPNGEYAIGVTDAGVTLSHGVRASIELVGDTVAVRGDLDVTVQAGRNVALQGSAGLDLSGSLVEVDGSMIRLNGGAGCRAVARSGDLVSVVIGDPPPPQTLGQIIAAGTVCAG